MVNFWKILQQNQIPEWEPFYLQYLQGTALLTKIYQQSHVDRPVPMTYMEEQRTSQLNLEVALSDSDQVPTVQPEPDAVIPRFHAGESWLHMTRLEGPTVPTEEKEFIEFLESEFKRISDFYKKQEDLCLESFNELNKDLCDQSSWRTDAELTLALNVRSKELYRGLDLLRSFRVYNYTGFVKLLKRHRKHSLLDFEDILLTFLNKSQLVRAPLCAEMRAKLEEVFAAAFHHRDMKKGNIDLRGTRVINAEGDFVSFILGVSVGISVVLFAVFAATVGLVGRITQQDFFIPVFPLYRGLGMILLLIWVWGADVKACESRRINHAFILKVYHREHLRAVDVFNIAGLLTMIYALFLVGYFGFSSPTVVRAFGLEYVKSEYFSLCLFLLVLLTALNPFPVFYHTTRFYLIKSFARVCTAPFHQVKFVDFFLADQLCSLVKVMQDIAYSFCFIFSGAFVNSDASTCTLFALRAQYVVAFLPYWFRLAQSLRRYFTEKPHNRRHLWGSGKYFCAMLVTLFSLLQIRGAWIFLSIVATMYNIVWDIKMDWGLLEPGPAWPLRTKLRLSHKWIYYVCAFIDVGLRISWVLTLSPDVFQQDEVVLVLSSLEILRRGINNFFRLENEFLNNCGKFRAVDTTPIPLLPAVIVPDLPVHAKLPRLAPMNSLVFTKLSHQVVDSAHTMQSRFLDGGHAVGNKIAALLPHSHQVTPVDRHTEPEGTSQHVPSVEMKELNA